MSHKNPAQLPQELLMYLVYLVLAICAHWLTGNTYVVRKELSSMLTWTPWGLNLGDRELNVVPIWLNYVKYFRSTHTEVFHKTGK